MYRRMQRWLRRLRPKRKTKEQSQPFKDSQLAHHYLDGLTGCEIGASAHNPFNIEGTVFVDYTDDTSTEFKQMELEAVNETQKVDVVAMAWDLPFESESQDFVLSSHVIEHCFDVIGTIKEWFRVVRPGGYIFMIIPHMERTFDKGETPTPVEELVKRHRGELQPTRPATDHHSFWRTNDFISLVEHEGWRMVDHQDTDDKVGNGFTIVLQK